MPADVRIRKHKIAVQASNERVAVRCRQIIAELATRELQPLYERIFNQQEENSTSYLNIGKVQIDLGTMTEKEIEMNFINALELQIRSVLEQLLEQSPAYNGTPGHSDQHRAQDAEKLTAVTYRSEPQQNAEALRHYLEQGHYPWWIDQEKRVSADELYRKMSNAEREELLLFLIRRFESWTDAQRKAAVKRIRAIVNKVAEAEAIKTIQQLSRLFSNSALEKNVDTLLESSLHFSAVFGIKSRVIHEKLLYTILNTETHAVMLKHFVESLFKDHKVANQQALELLFKDTHSPMSSLAVLDNLNESGSLPSQALEAQHDHHGAKSKSDRTEVYINNAGLIILHPFLPPFFNIVGLTNELNQFKRLEDQTLATVLLHYLQTGNTAYQEWDMTLNKVLCGLEPSAAIDDDICIPDKAIQESRLLLMELIEHWTALKSSSIESVQHSFFTRSGKLSFNGTAWQLQVERTAMDVLVDRLPWGLSVVRLPWNNQLIYTEW